MTKKVDESSLAYVHLMKKIKDASNTPIVNDRECPLLTPTQHIKAINTNTILSAVSIVHECTDDCKITTTRKTIVERENVTIPDGYHVEHDYSNDFFCLNVYCMKCIHQD